MRSACQHSIISPSGFPVLMQMYTRNLHCYRARVLFFFFWFSISSSQTSAHNIIIRF